MIFSPLACFLLQKKKYVSVTITIRTMIRDPVMQAQRPGLYPGASCCLYHPNRQQKNSPPSRPSRNRSTHLNTKLPAMPPMPPNATSVALQNARFHCPRMLLACQLIMCGMLEFAPAHVKKTPAYCDATPGAQPIIASPMIVSTARLAMMGPRIRYLSATQAVENMIMPAKASGNIKVSIVSGELLYGS